MNILSKEAFERAVVGRTCADFIHPWASTCTGGFGKMCVSGIKGGAKFSLALFLLQILIKGRKLRKSQAVIFMEHSIRLTLMGTLLAGIFTVTSCVLRNRLGRFDYKLSLFVPASVSGLAIFVVMKDRRHIVISAFTAAALETAFSIFVASRNWTKSTVRETFLFMITNALFLYFTKLWKTNKQDQPLPELWFFSPNQAVNKPQQPSEKCKNSSPYRPCNHIHSCLKSTLKESSNYFWCGTAIEVLRVTIKNFGKIVADPKLIAKFAFKTSNLKLAAFAGSYVFLYKVTHCILCRLRGKDEISNALLAGFISGLAYSTNPNISLNMTVLTNLIHVTWKYFNLNEKLVGDFPTSEMLFVLAWGFLFHCRAILPSHCSRFFIHITSLVTSGRSDEMYESFKKLLL